METKRDIEFLYEVGSFRHMKRMWQRFLNPDFQNNTEHSFRVAWIALALAAQEKTGNHEKILKMALAHDLSESRCGDVDYVARLYTKRDEHTAVKDIFADTSLGEEFTELVGEYEKRECLEAKIVKDADHLDVEFELREQGTRGHAIGGILQTRRDESVYPKLSTESARRMWRDIRVSNPFDWHLLGVNRFSKGDWQSKG
ncbi:MAG: HD domain-containing protein [Candidatus Sungbacteria bacterium]|uniref:5'-deoxynucleotidase n=1 Tax=Candidatus Sungiibacteriota bacterium TaxID=2750080 RepID=A0A932QZQ3_9BACT|nr:HD domain-containing protein [Candidatus Sungbacteria bacterium]